MPHRMLDIDDSLGHEAGALLSDSIMALKERLDEALHGSTDDRVQTLHKTRAVSKLRKRGILMELDSDSVAVWFAQDHVRQNSYSSSPRASTSNTTSFMQWFNSSP